MLTALIIDDERKSRTFLKGALEMHCPDVKVLGEADGVNAGIEAMRNHQPQVVFLDIQMGDGSGFDLLEGLRKDPRTAEQEFEVIFTTAFNQYAIKAIKFSAMDYLLKPIDPDELMEAVAKIRKKTQAAEGPANLQVLLENFKELQKVNKKIALSTAEKTHVYKVSEIIRCESQDSYTLFHLREGKPLLVSRTLKDFEELLTDYNFERIHKSHLVNLDYLKAYQKTDGGYVLMEDGAKIPVSNRKKERINQILKSL